MNPAVLIWVAVSAIGLLLTLTLVNESRLDLVAIGKTGNGRRTVALARLAKEGMRATTQGLYLLAGLIALGLVPLTTAVIVPILIVGNVVMAANSVIDHRTRRLLYATRRGEPDLEPPA